MLLTVMLSAGGSHLNILATHISMLLISLLPIYLLSFANVVNLLFSKLIQIFHLKYFIQFIVMLEMVSCNFLYLVLRAYLLSAILFNEGGINVYTFLRK